MRQISRGIQLSKIGVASAVLERMTAGAGKKYLIESFSRIPGLPRKVSQYLESGVPVAEASEPPALPVEWASSKINKEVPKLAQNAQALDSSAVVASLGQVHRVLLKTGGELAVKVQFDGLYNELSVQLDLLMVAFEKIGSAKKMGIDTEIYRSHFEEIFLDELDYGRESENQSEFWEMWSAVPHVHIPKAHFDYSCKEVLTQDYLPSRSIDEAKQDSKKAKREMSDHVVEFFCRSLLEFGLLHSDFHSRNYGFKGTDLVVYDFGSVLRIDLHQRGVLLALLQAVSERDEDRSMDCLAEMGFDRDKIFSLKGKILHALEIILEPFLGRTVWKPASWNFKARLDQVLGTDRRLFRSAGPPWFFSLMKAFHGYFEAIKMLDSEVSFSRWIEDDRSQLLDSIPRLSWQPVSQESFETADNLKVSVVEKGEEVVYLELPVQSVDSLEDLIPSEARTRIEELGYDLVGIRKRVQGEGYFPQNLFEADTGVKKYRVWLE